MTETTQQKATTTFRRRWLRKEVLTKTTGPALLVVFILAIGLMKPSFFSAASITVLLEESAVILLLALGQTVVILLGGIDLSNAALASLLAVVLAMTLPGLGVLAIVLTVVLGMLAAAGLGAIHSLGQIPSFIVTLGGLGVWGGVALTLAGASTVLVRDGYPVVGWLMGDLAGLPIVVLFAAAAGSLLGVAMRVRPFGRRLYMIGSAESVAMLSGVRTVRYRIAAFAISGLFSALTAIVLIARLKSASATVSDGLLLPAIAAVVVGGTAVTGGVGSVWRTMVGALMIGVLRVGLSVVGVPPAQQQIVYGLLVILAVAASLDRRPGTVVA